jgi:hypothetical protein
MVSPERVSLSSSSNGVTTPFSRLAQASNLLGRVIRHCNDRTMEGKFALDDFYILCQMITSLIELVPVDDSLSSMELCVASSICFR